MAPTTDRSLLTHVANLDDPRVERTKLHPLVNILTIATCAVICGAESWNEMAAFGSVTVSESGVVQTGNKKTYENDVPVGSKWCLGALFRIRTGDLVLTKNAL